jgi:hypothetical protein
MLLASDSLDMSLLRNVGRDTALDDPVKATRT